MKEGGRLTRRPCVIGGQTREDDWEILWDGVPVGRIMRRTGNPIGTDPWSWHVQAGPPMHGLNGTAESFDAARAAFAKRWSEVWAEINRCGGR